jgi:hypothetical protein
LPCFGERYCDSQKPSGSLPPEEEGKIKEYKIGMSAWKSTNQKSSSLRAYLSKPCAREE